MGAQTLLKNVEMGMLCDFYGGLLTQRQRLALRLSLEEDLSLGEIAQRLNVTRQNVHELIARSEQKLRRYEAALGGLERQRRTVRALQRVCELLQGAREADAEAPRALVERVIRLQEGEDEHGL